LKIIADKLNVANMKELAKWCFIQASWFYAMTPKRMNLRPKWRRSDPGFRRKHVG